MALQSTASKSALRSSTQLCATVARNACVVKAAFNVHDSTAIKSSTAKKAKHLQNVSSRRSSVIVRAAAPAKPFKEQNARLVLEDGTVFKGCGFGATGTEIGEVVFNTSLTGYQEIMTDPSYKGQFVCFTLPHIGNTGANMEDLESSKCHLGAIIVRDLSITVSNYRSKMDLDTYCKQQGVVGLANVDTRALTKKLRQSGCLVGVVSTDASKTTEELVAMAKGWTIVGKDLLSVVSCTEPYEWTETTDNEWEFNPRAKERNNGKPFHVVAYDYGIKLNILRRLASLGCRVTVVPATYPASEVLAMNPDGVFFSNGPGDPSAAPYAVANAKEILGKKPVFGICMGHQILGQAFGGKTFKLSFGHHGGNHPIRYNPTGRIEVSSQNHNFAVDPATLPAGVQVTHINLNDGTCAGMVWADKKAMTIQYHPEASPGPHDADVCFDQFIDMMAAERKVLATA
jgi:carbamoyl-phosphate synthase small subunit